MKIAVFGWYGHDNAGDERIKYCLSSFINSLGGVNCIDFYDLHKEAIAGATSRFDEYNLIIIGGGGLILSRHNYHDFIMALNTNVVTLGISVETELTGNPKKFAQALIEKSHTVLVRDHESYQKMKTLDLNNKVLLSVDVTFLAPYDVALTGRSIDTLAVNLMVKTREIPLVFKIKNHFSRFSQRFFPQPFCFKTLMCDLEKSYTLLPVPLFCEEKPAGTPLFQANDVIFLQEYFQNVPKTFHHTALDTCDAFLSMRLHGLIFAAQKAIPFATFATYPKQKNFMQEIGLDHLCMDIRHLDQAHKTLSHIDNNRTTIREKILTYRSKAIQQSQEDLTRIMNHVLR